MASLVNTSRIYEPKYVFNSTFLYVKSAETSHTNRTNFLISNKNFFSFDNFYFSEKRIFWRILVFLTKKDRLERFTMLFPLEQQFPRCTCPCPFREQPNVPWRDDPRFSCDPCPSWAWQSEALMGECRHKRWFRWPSLVVFSQCRQRTSFGTLVQLFQPGYLCNVRERPKIRTKTNWLDSLNNLKRIFMKTNLKVLINLSKASQDSQ